MKTKIDKQVALLSLAFVILGLSLIWEPGLWLSFIFILIFMVSTFIKDDLPFLISLRGMSKAGHEDKVLLIGIVVVCSIALFLLAFFSFKRFV